MELSDYLSFIAIVASIVTLAVNLYTSNKFHKSNLEATYYTDVFSNYLMVKIPKARKYINYRTTDKTLIGSENLQKIVVSLRKDSLFFKYKDKKFYDNLEEQTLSLEDYLLKHEGEKMTENKYDLFSKQLDEEIEKLYFLINNNYLG